MWRIDTRVLCPYSPQKLNHWQLIICGQLTNQLWCDIKTWDGMFEKCLWFDIYRQHHPMMASWVTAVLYCVCPLELYRSYWGSSGASLVIVAGYHCSVCRHMYANSLQQFCNASADCQTVTIETSAAPLRSASGESWLGWQTTPWDRGRKRNTGSVLIQCLDSRASVNSVFYGSSGWW